jgi:hypothetical protein
MVSMQVLPGSTATLSVQVQQLAANESPANDATSQSEQLQWAPYALVPEGDKELCNVVEVSIKQLGTLPPKLQVTSTCTFHAAAATCSSCLMPAQAVKCAMSVMPHQQDCCREPLYARAVAGCS